MQHRHRAQKQFLRYKHATILLQQRYRYRRVWRFTVLLQCRYRYIRLRRAFHAAILTIQRTRRALLIRRSYLHTRKATILFQSLTRRHIAMRMFTALVATTFNNLRNSVALLWQSSRTLFAYRTTFYSTHATTSLTNIRAYRLEQQRLKALTASELKTMRKAQRTERRTMESIMKHHMSEAEILELFQKWTVPTKARYRKRKLLKTVFAQPTRLDEAVQFVIMIERLIPPSSSAHH